MALLMSKDPEGLNDIARFDGEAKVYPNPVADKVNVSLSLNKLSTKVSYEIVDITGKSIAMSTKSNVKMMFIRTIPINFLMVLTL